MRRFALALLLALATSSWACFDEPSPACAFSCTGAAHACPEGYACGDDGICRKPGTRAACPLDPDADGGVGE